MTGSAGACAAPRAFRMRAPGGPGAGGLAAAGSRRTLGRDRAGRAVARPDGGAEVPVEITWWGHATCTVEDSGMRVLTDPLFARRLAHLRRRRGRGAPARGRGRPTWCSSRICTPTICICRRWRGSRPAPGCWCRGARARGAGAAPARRAPEPAGLRITEVDAGDEVEVGDLVVRAVPARHDGRRLPVGPHRCPALGYVIRARPGPTSPGTPGSSTRWRRRSDRSTWRCCRSAAGGRISGPNIWTPGGRREALARLAPGAAVPVHYGTYWPIGMDAVRPHEFHAPGDEFVRQAAQLAPAGGGAPARPRRERAAGGRSVIGLSP